MPIINSIRNGLERLAALRVALKRQSEFSCSDCERWQQCGLPPKADCIERVAQMERGDWKVRRDARALLYTSM